MIKKVVIVATVALVLLLVVAYFVGSQSKFVVKSDPVKASRDQEILINGFGYPDTFVLAMEKGERVEVWNYYGLRRSFTFKNGVFIADRIIDSLESLEAYPDLRPTQFKVAFSPEEINEIIGVTPTEEVDLIPELMENARLYRYADQVLVGTVDDRIIFVRTLPVNTS